MDHMNTWYVAAWAKHISREPVGHVILDEPIALFRKLDEIIVTWEDVACGSGWEHRSWRQ